MDYAVFILEASGWGFVDLGPIVIGPGLTHYEAVNMAWQMNRRFRLAGERSLFYADRAR